MSRSVSGTLSAAALVVLATGCGGGGGPKAGVTAPLASASSGDSAAASGGPASAGPVPGSTHSAAPAPGTTSQAGAPTTPHCSSSALHATVTGYDAGAGQRYARLILTNVSGSTCRTKGWPGLGLGNASEGFGANTTRTGTAATLLIAPGGHAWSQLHWTAIPAADETASPCEPNPTVLQVIPPDETTVLVASWSGGSVCQHNHFLEYPLVPGTGP